MQIQMKFQTHTEREGEWWSERGPTSLIHCVRAFCTQLIRWHAFLHRLLLHKSKFNIGKKTHFFTFWIIISVTRANVIKRCDCVFSSFHFEVGKKIELKQTGRWKLFSDDKTDVEKAEKTYLLRRTLHHYGRLFVFFFRRSDGNDVTMWLWVWVDIEIN